MKLIENKYSMHIIKPKPMCIPVPKKRSPALVKAQQKYYEKNKAQITLKQTQYNKMYSKMTHVCECGDVISNSAKYSHIKSKRHLRRVANIQKGLPAGTTHGETIIDCECGGHYKYNQRHQHYRTKRHHKYEAEKQAEIKRKLEEATQDTVQESLYDTQEHLKNQLRRMLFEEDIEETDISDNVNSNQIKVL
tara:strand:- start:319 stop:894 length:576 start_codon:yes stop_codon:yes gene_type:complete